MRAKFVELPSFTRASKDILGDSELRELQAFMMENPNAGDVIPGSAGCRKIRWQRIGMGKRGGLRVIFLAVGRWHNCASLRIR